MAVSIVSTVAAQGNGVSSLTWNHTLSGSNVALAILLADQSNYSGLTINGTAYTSFFATQNVTSPNPSVYMFMPTGASIGSTGVQTIVASNSFAEDMLAYSVLLNGVKQNANPTLVCTPNSASGTSTAPSVTMTGSVASDQVLAFAVWGNTAAATEGAGLSSLAAGLTTTNLGSDFAKAAGGATSTAWTLSVSKPWAAANVTINAAPGTTHDATGAITGPGTTVAGSASRFRAHGTSGAIAGPGAAVVGSAARSGAPLNHATSGAITGPGAVVAGTAKLTKTHDTSGAIAGPGAVLAGAAALAQRLSNIKDDFSGAFDTTKWTATVTAGTATAANSNGQLVLNPTSGNSGDGIEVRNNVGRPLIDEAIFVRMSQAPRTAANAQGVEARFALEASAGNAIGWYPQSDGSIQAQRRVGGTAQDNLVLSYTPSTHAWLRLKEAAGQFYMQSAPSSAQDPPLEAEWTTQYQIATASIGFSLTNVKIVLGCVVWWNQAGVPTQPTAFDCINTKTIAPVSHNATGAIAGPGAVLAGAAAKKVLHATSGAIPGQAAVLAGAVMRRKEHFTSGDIYGPGAIISANGSTSDVTRKVWFDTQDTAGAWSESPQTADPWTTKSGADGGWGPK